MNLPASVKIVEVGPRDGLQNEATIVSVEARLELIKALGASGMLSIEVGSFVSPKRLPQMQDTARVLNGLNLNRGIRYPVLVPNLRGMQDALGAGAKEISVFASASETFSQRNINCSVAASMARYARVIEVAKEHNIAVRAYISCVLGCPYEGDVALNVVADIAKQFRTLGCYEVSLGDTIGVGTPLKAREMVQALADDIGIEHLAVHFHDSYGQALANIVSCLDLGLATIDSAVAGLGGCPYAKGASGNVASEDVVYMLENMGITTGVDLDMLIKTGRNICAQLNIPVKSKVNLAWRNLS